MRGLIFDLDGTLVDTVYAHVFAWQRAFAEAGLAIDGWRIHRRIGMSGGLFARAAARELGHAIDGSAPEPSAAIPILGSFVARSMGWGCRKLTARVARKLAARVAVASPLG